MNQLSLAQLTVNDACGPDLVEAAAKAGFDAVGLRVISPAGVVQHPKIAGNEAKLREVERSLSATGLKVLDVNSFWITPQTRADDFKPVLEAAVRLRAPQVLVVIDDRNVSRGSAVLAECGALAATAGIKLALEFQPYGAVRNLAETRAIIDRIGLSNIGIVLDALHLYRSGGGAADIAALPSGLLLFAQLCDARRASPGHVELRVESRGHRLYPGEGELPLLELMDALPANIPLDIETPCQRGVGLPFDEQARLAADATRRFLANWQESKKR